MKPHEEHTCRIEIYLEPAHLSDLSGYYSAHDLYIFLKRIVRIPDKLNLRANQ